MILVCVEQQLESCLETIAKAQQLARDMDCDLAAVLIGPTSQSFGQQLTQYCDSVFTVENERFENLEASCFEKAISIIVEKIDATLVLMPYSSNGMELAPSLALGLDATLATDCVALESTGDTFKAVRKTHGGKVNTYLSLQGERVVVSLRAGIFGSPLLRVDAGSMEVIDINFDDIPCRKRVIDRIAKVSTGDDITKADIIIDAGRGVKDEDDLEMLRNLADALGGIVGCSRPLVDLGWLDYSHQIGISGKTVKAKLLLAVGVSGSYQHLAGIDGCNTIIAINEDPNAPIHGISDIAVLADLYEVVPALTNKLRSLKP